MTVRVVKASEANSRIGGVPAVELLVGFVVKSELLVDSESYDDSIRLTYADGRRVVVRGWEFGGVGFTVEEA